MVYYPDRLCRVFYQLGTEPEDVAGIRLEPETPGDKPAAITLFWKDTSRSPGTLFYPDAAEAQADFNAWNKIQEPKGKIILVASTQHVQEGGGDLLPTFQME